MFISTNKHSKFDIYLHSQDLNVLDDHRPPQQIVRFSQQTDLPLELGLLIDTSGSVHSRFQFEQEAAIGFLQHTIRAHYDHAFVEGFNTRGRLAQESTDNVTLLA